MSRSYLFTLTFFILHQMDAAYWHEWDMFYNFPPGGIQGYLLYNLVLIPLLLVGYKNVLLCRASAVIYSYFCAGLGLLVFLVHGSFLIAGYDQFKLPTSMGIILGCFIAGAWQMLETIRAKPTTA